VARNKGKKPSGSKRNPRKPRDWDKAISVAYIRMIGFPNVTQKQAATEAGTSERSVRAWEASPWWPDAQAEARQRWLRGGDAAAMSGILEGMKDPAEYAQMSRYWADRRIPELTPPRQRKEHTGPDGGPIQHVTHDLSNLTDEELELAEQLIQKSALDDPAD
jgi:hypothetical protein